MTKHLSVWPDHFDLSSDPVFENQIKPFIENELKKQKEFHKLRPKDTTYIFHEHAVRVAEDMRKTARHMGMARHVCENLYWSTLPHDIGKRLLPADIWDTEEKPSEELKQLRRSHTKLGFQLVDEAFPDINHPLLGLIRDIMLKHHEMMDGTGYLGLSGDELSLPVRLACIIESFDGYQIWRPHFADRDISNTGVLKRMREEKGPAFYDMDLFEAFADMKIKEKDRKNILPPKYDSLTTPSCAKTNILG